MLPTLIMKEQYSKSNVPKFDTNPESVHYQVDISIR